MKRITFTILSLIVFFALASCGAPRQTFINIASGGTGGTYYPLAGAMANIWQDNIRGLNASAQTTGASVTNVNLLREGKADVIFVQNDIAFYAINGLEMFKDQAIPELRGMVTLYPETCQLIVLSNSGITTVADLRGKKVAVGAAGSGVEANARQIMAAAGLTYADILVQYLNFNEASSNLKNGNIDAAFLTAGHPTAAVQDISATKSIKIIPIGADLAGKLISLYPFYTRTVIPAGTYSGIDMDVQTVAVKAMLAVSTKLDSGTIEKMLQTLFANNDRLSAAHKAGALVTLKTARDGMSLPLHPGAEKYYGKAK
ncbi:MAG: TAXI family TRAP transporter solute-binding subunit [Spirochaetales bacterium]|nr:MAG: TAXI family TRAP transporter solute-binding subunit [Spirochaetales bacterium]